MSLTSDTPITMPVAPVGYGNCGNDGFGGGNYAWWIIILFLFAFMGWGNRGMMGNGGGSNGYDTRADVQRGFDTQAVISKLDGISNGICDSTFALNNAINNGFSTAELSRCNQQSALMSQLFAMQMANQQCCCDLRSGQADLKFQAASDTCALQNTMNMNTRDLLENQNSNTRAILDYLCQDKISTLQQENQTLRLAASQSNQNAVIGARIDAATAEILRKTGAECPMPAYVVQPPQPVTFPTNCCGQASFGNGYGGCNNCGF